MIEECETKPTLAITEPLAVAKAANSRHDASGSGHKQKCAKPREWRTQRPQTDVRTRTGHEQKHPEPRE